MRVHVAHVERFHEKLERNRGGTFLFHVAFLSHNAHIL
jgi:hypothetical protein